MTTQPKREALYHDHSIIGVALAQSIAIKNACSRELSKAKFSTCCAKGWEVCDINTELWATIAGLA
jgi:hypothetical protein